MRRNRWCTTGKIWGRCISLSWGTHRNSQLYVVRAARRIPPNIDSEGVSTERDAIGSLMQLGWCSFTLERCLNFFATWNPSLGVHGILSTCRVGVDGQVRVRTIDSDWRTDRIRDSAWSYFGTGRVHSPSTSSPVAMARVFVFLSTVSLSLDFAHAGAPDQVPILRSLAFPKYFGTATNTTFLYNDNAYTQLASTHVRIYELANILGN